MVRCRLTALTSLIAALIFGAAAPVVHAHGGHGGGGHGGFGGHHGGFGGYRGFGYGGYGYRGFGYGGYGFRGFGYPGFGYGFGYGLGYGLGLGGLGYGYGGYGYGGYGYGGLGYGYGGLGYGGYGGYGYGGCGYYPGYWGYGYGPGYGGYGGFYPISTIPDAADDGSFLSVSRAGSRSPYVDYYTRTSPSTEPSRIASRSAGAPSRYVDYYASKSKPVVPVQSEEEGVVRTVALTPDNKARIQVTLPTNAKLWVNGQPLQAIGPQREYVSAKLVPERVYTCRLKATWTDKGRAFEERSEVKVRANEMTRVTFGTPLP